MSEWMKKWWFVLIAGIGLAIIAFSEAKNAVKVSGFLDRLTLKLPIFGNIAYQAVIARFAVLSTTFAAGVPLLTP